MSELESNSSWNRSLISSVLASKSSESLFLIEVVAAVLVLISLILEKLFAFFRLLNNDDVDMMRGDDDADELDGVLC